MGQEALRTDVQTSQRRKFGRPKGSPNVATYKRRQHISALARSFSPRAIRVLVEIMNDKKATDSARVAAAGHILDRAYGKAPLNIELGEDVEMVIRRVERVVLDVGEVIELESVK